MAVKIGIIAEEQSDIDVLYELTCKLTPENSFGFSKFVSHGCGKLRKKCRAWSQNLLQRGCTYLVVIHDLDEYVERDLRSELLANVRDLAFTSHIILIPKYEIEAWLLFDPLGLKQVFSMKKTPVVPKNPEAVKKPKEKLRDVVWKNSKKHYINTIHNKRIAAAIRIDRLSPCHSFSPYSEFLTQNIKN